MSNCCLPALILLCLSPPSQALIGGTPDLADRFPAVVSLRTKTRPEGRVAIHCESGQADQPSVMGTMVMSTRRLRRRPSGVALLAMGLFLP